MTREGFIREDFGEDFPWRTGTCLDSEPVLCQTPDRRRQILLVLKETIEVSETTAVSFRF